MIPEYVVRELLRTDPAVAGLVGDRISPRGEQAAKQKPHVVYLKVSDTRRHGLNLVRVASRQVRVQLDLAAASHAGVKALEDAVVGRLQGFQGQVGETYLEACFCEDARDDPENPAPATTGDFRVSVDVILTPRV